MADPVTVARLGYTLLKNWKPLVIVMVSIISLILLLLTSFISAMFPFLTGDPADFNKYKRYASVEGVNWKEAYSLDAFRYDGEFSKADPEVTVSLFVEETTEKVLVETKDDGTEVYEERTIKRIKPLHEVLASLGIVGDDALAIQEMAMFLEDEQTYGEVVGGSVPPEMMEWFLKGEKDYGIPWYILAAIARRESTFNPKAIGQPNPTGELAQGLMQFLPSTWKAYGLDANTNGARDPFEYQDAIVSAAHYLQVLGATSDDQRLRQALYVYSGGSSSYADEIFEYANTFKNLSDLSQQSFRLYPLDSFAEITSGYGDSDGRSKPHNGIDFGAPTGVGVVAVQDGEVVSVLPEKYSGGYGNLVVIQHQGEYQTYYAHLSSIAVSPGMRVKKDDRLGAVGSTGRSTGPHLHFEVRTFKNGAWRDINPVPLLQTGSPY